MKVRNANLEDLISIDKVFRKNHKFVGFVMKVAIEEAIQKKRVLVCEDESGEIVGAVNFAPTKKGYITIYEIAAIESGKGIGKLLIQELKKLKLDIKLKVTEDNLNAYEFYKRIGFSHITTEQGKKRKLHVMYMKNSLQNKLF